MSDVARRFWRLLEPIHGVVYFAPDARARFDAVGLQGFWMGYFASRSAALGPVGPEVVTAAFFVFEPSMVARALPDAWTRASPEAVLAARAELADVTLRGALGALADSDEVAVAAEVAVEVAGDVPLGGRPLAASHRALPIPPDDHPLARLWWAATVLREHRGDGHVAALLSADVDPCAALVLAAATGSYGEGGAKLLRTSRQWSDEQWGAATDRLTRRGWLAADGTLTEAGTEGHQAIEATTDRLAEAAYAPVPDADLVCLATALHPLVTRLAVSNALPFPNPIGVDPRPGRGR